MYLRARSLLIVAGLALSLPTFLAAGDDHAHPAPAPAKPAPAHAADDRTPATPAPATTGPAASKSRSAIWESARANKDKASEPTEEDDRGGHNAPAAKPRKQPSGSRVTTTGEVVKPKAAQATEPVGTPTADEALTLLTEGNQRWVEGTTENPSIESARREDLAANGQHPFVTLLTCADSRIPVERVFDRGVGELFVVRVAGNVAGNSETGTVEYGVGHLKTPLLVVMGHTKCGAVAAACTGGHLPGKVGELVAHVTPAVERARRNNPDASEAELPALAVKENVWQTVFDLLKGSPDLRAKVSASELRIVGAIYDIASGEVSFMGEHPWQTEIVSALNAAAPVATAGSATNETSAQADTHDDH